MNSIMLERPDLENLIGANNINMMKDNHANHVRFVGSILKNYNPDVLVNTILWVFKAYRGHGFNTNYWAAQMNTWISIIKEEFTRETYEAVYPYYEWMQVNIPQFVCLSDDELDDSKSMH